jgi:hypothetical protein
MATVPTTGMLWNSCALQNQEFNSQQGAPRLDRLCDPAQLLTKYMTVSFREAKLAEA